MQKKSDGELMNLIAQGNQAAFQEVFHRYGGRLLGFCRRLMGNSASGEDISQEVWVRCIRSASSYQDRGSLQAWLYTIAKNLSLNHLRQQNRWTLTDDDASLELHQDALISQGHLDDLLSQEADQEKIRAFVDGLPDAQRAALVIWMSGDLSYEQIALEMKTTVGRVKSLLHRARQSMQDRLRKNSVGVRNER